MKKKIINVPTTKSAIAEFFKIKSSAVYMWFASGSGKTPRTRPTLEKMAKLKSEFQIPYEYWLEPLF